MKDAYRNGLFLRQFIGFSYVRHWILQISARKITILFRVECELVIWVIVLYTIYNGYRHVNITFRLFDHHSFTCVIPINVHYNYTAFNLPLSMEDELCNVSMVRALIVWVCVCCVCRGISYLSTILTSISELHNMSLNMSIRFSLRFHPAFEFKCIHFPIRHCSLRYYLQIQHTNERAFTCEFHTIAMRVLLSPRHHNVETVCTECDYSWILVNV